MRQHDFQHHAHDDFADDADFGSDVPRRRRRPRFDDEAQPTRSGRLTEAAKQRLSALRADAVTETEIPGGGDRWSTWGDCVQGPHPLPGWVVTELGAVDTELGVLKTGKEADVHLLRRGLPDAEHGCLLAAKRYRGDEHRLFHRDAGYLEGRRMRRSREMRAMRHRTSFGRNLVAEQWAVAEFATLSTLWSAGAPVPYPVQRDGTELLLEFIGDADGTAAPRLAELRPRGAVLRDLWHQITTALESLAVRGLAHGDLSAYNILVHNGQIVLIDLPQVVDVVANPSGSGFLARDVRNIAAWFAARGLPEDVLDVTALTADLHKAVGLT